MFTQCAGRKKAVAFVRRTKAKMTEQQDSTTARHPGREVWLLIGFAGLLVAAGWAFENVVETSIVASNSSPTLPAQAQTKLLPPGERYHVVTRGLVGSTLLTLIVVPVILTFIDAFAKWISRFLPEAPLDEQSRPAVRANAGTLEPPECRFSIGS